MNSDELDDLINDLDIALDKKAPAAGPKPQTQSTTKTEFLSQNQVQQQPQQFLKKKCGIVRLGDRSKGSVCQQMRCLKCDLKVNSFENKQWLKEATYLVFRNYFSDIPKLQTYLEPMPGKFSYCCQCMSVTASEREDAPAQWICIGH